MAQISLPTSPELSKSTRQTGNWQSLLTDKSILTMTKMDLIFFKLTLAY
jgi:hypothetical protein